MTLTDTETERRMNELLLRLAPQQGYTQSLLEGVRFLRSDQPIGRIPVLYEPSIVIVSQGRKRGYLGDRVYRYDAQHFLVLSVPLPFSSETDASPEEPMLAFAVRLDMTAIADLVIALAEEGMHPAAAPEGIVSTPLNAPMQNTALRLLEALSSPVEAKVLGPALVRELCYRVLIGEQGGAIRAALGQHGQFGRVSRVLRRIHADYPEPLDVGGLARDAGLSVAAFHSYFKAVTRTSPIQYIKAIRLHQARLLMIRDGLTAAAASARVGYESPSQFNREFKRQFGRSPGEETRSMKEAFALHPPAVLRTVGMPRVSH